MKSHQNNTKAFEELSFSGQAKSISAQVLSLEKAIKAHERRAIKEKRIGSNTLKNRRIVQVRRMLSRLSK
jgi:hypothetical protein